MRLQLSCWWDLTEDPFPRRLMYVTASKRPQVLHLPTWTSLWAIHFTSWYGSWLPPKRLIQERTEKKSGCLLWTSPGVGKLQPAGQIWPNLGQIWSHPFLYILFTAAFTLQWHSWVINCNRIHIAYKAKSIYSLALFSKSVPTPHLALEVTDLPFCHNLFLRSESLGPTHPQGKGN